jgi:MFS family permease
MKAILTEIRLPKEAEFGLFSLVHGDRLGSLIGRFAIRSRVYAVSIAAMLSFSAALIAVIEGSLFNTDLSLDLAHDIGWWNQFLLAFPTLIYIAGAYFGAFPITLRQLTDSGVLQASNEDWKRVRRFTKAKLTNPSFVLLPYVVGFSSAALTSSFLQSRGTWYAADQYIAGYLIPVHAFFLYFFMTYLALRLYSAFLILRMLFRFDVNIQPFHPDGCGGLGSLMGQSEKLYWGMIVYGVIAALGILSNTLVYGLELFSLYNFGMLLSYVLLTGIAFFLPLYALTESMRNAKQKLLTSIKDRYRALNEKQGGGANDLDGLSDEHVADLKALRSLQQTARSMQVWPFNRGSLIRFTCAIATPILIVSIALLFFR